MSRPGVVNKRKYDSTFSNINDHIPLLHNAFEATVQKTI